MDVDELRAAGVVDSLEHLERAVTELQAGQNVALTTPPHGCESVYLAYVEEQLAAERIQRFDITNGEVTLPDEGIIIAENCQSLYTRQIGGFDALDSFLQQLANTDCTVLASWNQYTWRYLVQAKDLDIAFPVQLSPPTLSATELQTLFETVEGELPEFVFETEGNKPDTSTSIQASILGQTINLPVPSFLTEDEETVDPRKQFFDRLAKLSGGYPGIAQTIWEQTATAETVAPNALPDVPTELDLADETTFVLMIVLSNGSLRRETLSRIVSDANLDRALSKLNQRELIDYSDESVSITPVGVVRAASYLERRRLLW